MNLDKLDPEVAEKNAQKTLNHICDELTTGIGDTPEKKDFVLLRLQAAIIQFEICGNLVALEKTKPSSFSRKVVLKELIHEVYEYKPVFTQHHIRRICNLAENRGLINQSKRLRETAAAFRHGLKAIDKYQSLRHSATGHYDPDIESQVSTIGGIDENSAFGTIARFLAFNLEVLRILRDVGRNEDTQP